MHLFRLSVTALTAVAACVAIAAVAEAQTPRAPLTLEPIGASGEAIWPAFESWAQNEDGTLTLLLGHMAPHAMPVDLGFPRLFLLAEVDDQRAAGMKTASGGRING